MSVFFTDEDSPVSPKNKGEKGETEKEMIQIRELLNEK